MRTKAVLILGAFNLIWQGLIGGEGKGRIYHIYFMPHIKDNELAVTF